MRQLFVSLLIIAAVSITVLMPIPRSLAACGYLETDRNPPNYYVGDMVQISGGGFPPNQDFRVYLSSAVGRMYFLGIFTKFIPLSVQSDDNGQVSFSLGPLPAPSQQFPIGAYNVRLWCSPADPFAVNYASTNFYFAGQVS